MAQRYAITPGSMGAAWVALQLFGLDRVDVGVWTSPVYAYIEPDEVEPATELLAELDLTLTEAK